ncbi:MAG: zinc ribbon domain-containing protein [Chloroflexota bacterium]
MKKVWKWIIGIVVVLVVLAVVIGAVVMVRSHLLINANWGEPGTRLPGMMPYARGEWGGRILTMHSPGIMPFGGLFGGLFSLGLFTLVVLGIIFLVRKLMGHSTSSVPVPTCSHCGQPIQANWVACPHCGKKL